MTASTGRPPRRASLIASEMSACSRVATSRVATSRAARFRAARFRAASGVPAILAAAVVAATLVAPAPTAQARTTYPSDKVKPDLTAILVGYRSLWHASGDDDFGGAVRDAPQLRWNDRVTSWINQHATKGQQFRALQNAEYLGPDGSGYDQSITIADGLGERLGALYVRGRTTGRLPLTSQLLNTTNGTAGKFLDTGKAKSSFGYPRPYLPVSAGNPRAGGDSIACAANRVNGASLASLRKGEPWTTAAGDLRITRVAATTDTTRQFVTTAVRLDPGYGAASLCKGGSFPSGHSSAAYSAGITLATLLPELAPSILARTSEAANNRIVLGVHYALDVIGGRMVGEAAAAARWSDKRFRTKVLTPARTELVDYLEASCGDTLAACISSDTPYRNDPYAGQRVPLGGSQVVTDRTTAVIAYTERLSYGFTPSAPSGLGAAVPDGAANLLRIAFPTLTTTQRRQLLAQTQTASGNALDTTILQVLGRADGSWQRLNLAAAMSATVTISGTGTLTVLAVGAAPTVLTG